jgi:hypothetical protein
MNIALYLNEIMSPFSGTSQGFSTSAEFIRNEVTKVDEKLQSSYKLGMAGKGIINELYNSYIESSIPNWDGFGANPVSEASFEFSKDFIKRLPLNIEPPAICVDPDGHLTMEWYRNQRWTLSISFDPEGKIHFAALFGQDKIFGTVAYINIIPKNIITLIEKVISK